MSPEEDCPVFPGKDRNSEMSPVLAEELVKEGDMSETLSGPVGVDTDAHSPDSQTEIGGTEKESEASVDSPTSEAISRPAEVSLTESNPNENADQPDEETSPLALGYGTITHQQDGVRRFSVALGENVTLPNLTLGRGTDYIEYPLTTGITLDGEYAPDGRHWMETKEVKIEKTGKGFKVTPKEGVTGQLSFDVFYNEGKRAKFHLTVNPDPWSLWTVKEPTVMVFSADTDRVKNDHQSNVKYEDGAFTVIGASRRGRSHEHSGTFRDDDLGYWADEATGRYVFIVADGAGSARFSREGSRMAIQFLKDKLPANLTVEKWDEDGASPQPNGKVGVLLTTLAYHAYGHIAEFVKAENDKHPEDKWEVRDFNTTLLIAAVKRDAEGGIRLVTFAIGDGAIAWFDGEQSGLMCAPDGGEFSGGTRFLTTRSVWEKAGKDYQAFYKERVFCKSFTPDEAKRTTLFLMTDGVSDPWFETDAALNDTGMWRKFAEETLPGDGENQAHLKPDDTIDMKAQKLMDWLYFKITGNHDDRTLIVVQPRTVKSDSETDKKEVLNG